MDQALSALAFLQSESPEELPVDMETLMVISLVMTVVLLVIGIAVGYWVYKDASNRENNELAWALGVGASFLLFPIGLVVPVAYFVLRSDEVSNQPEETTTPAGDW
jgi:flagellar basal body-associated protein FliL